MTNPTTDPATKTIATALDTLADGLETLKRAHAELVWPGSDDVGADWTEVDAQLAAGLNAA